MNKILVAVLLSILLLGAGYQFVQKNKQTPKTKSISTQPTLEPTVQANAFCTSSQLQAVITTEGAAGNIYAKVTIENVSKTLCTVAGNNLLSIDYPTSVKNFKTVIKGQPQNQTFLLEPNQTIYSLIHYPNGPRCSGPTTEVSTAVTYQISQKDTITFKPTSTSTLAIPSCNTPSEFTSIDIYPFSEKEITQQ